MKRTKKIIITGPTCSGKNYVIEEKFSLIPFGVPLTTREIRKGEVNGKDYKFVTEKSFERLINECELKDFTRYEGEYHGLEKSEWETKSVFIMDPSGVNRITDEERSTIQVILIHAPLRIRIERMRRDRGWTCEKVLSRLIEDDIKYEKFDNYDLVIYNQ